MKHKFRRYLLGCLVLAAMLLSACGEAPSAPSIETQAETTAPHTTTIPQEETEASTAVNGLSTVYPNGGPALYLVDLSLYDAPNYNPFNMMAMQAVSIDFYDSNGESTMATYFLDKPIRNCALFNVLFQITYADDSDNSDVGWQCIYMKGSLEDVALEDRGTYIIPNSDYIAAGPQVFSLNEENNGYIDLATYDPIDLYGFTAIPVVAPHGWSSFMTIIKPQNALVGFLTEEDRQAFLDDLSI